MKEQKELQARTEKVKPEAIQREIADLHETLARKARIAEIEREIAEASSSQGTIFRSISPVNSFTEDSGWKDKKHPRTGLNPKLQYQYIRRQKMQ